MDRTTELRHVSQGKLFQLLITLDACDDWKRVMSEVPIDPLDIEQDKYELKYDLSHIRLIERHSRQSGKSPTGVFLEEWSISGKVLPKLETLKKLLDRLGLYKAMVDMAHLLGDPDPPRPKGGPAAPVDTNVCNILEMENIENGLHNIGTVTDGQFINERTYNNNIDRPNIEQNVRSRQFPNLEQPTGLRSTNRIAPSDMMIFSQAHQMEVESNELPVVPLLQVQSRTANDENENNNNSSDMPLMVSSMNRSTNENQLSQLHWKYEDLKQMTRSFADNFDVSQRLGGKIGKGGFGDVYLGFNENEAIAVKRLRISQNFVSDTNILLKQFQAEVTMTAFRHVNLVRVLGYSTDGPENLIVSEFISGGNLREKLDKKILNIIERFEIILGTAKGLQYLHYGTEIKLIHKDVKSPNILLTENCVPKLCDFGLTRIQDSETTQLIGTDAYVAPEVRERTITPKMDVYSYGIVLLEILTGLQPVVISGVESYNIKTFVQRELQRVGNTNDITPLLESTVSNWPIANDLYFLACKCLQDSTNRLDSNHVVAFLQKLNSPQ